MLRKRSIIVILAMTIVTSLFSEGCGKDKDIPEFSSDTMFTLYQSQPWIYETPNLTLKSDGTLIVLSKMTEIGREQISEEKMEDVKKLFNPEKVYTMDVGREDERTDGTSSYIILYDKDGNEIKIGGYELEGGDGFKSYFTKLYNLLQDEYTLAFHNDMMKCSSEGKSYWETYVKDKYKVIYPE